MSRHLVFVALLLLCGIVPLAGCQRSSPPPLRLGTNVWPGYEPLYLARELGLWQEESVRLVEYPSASEVIRAFRNQNLEAAALTLDEALYLRQNGSDVVIFLVTDISNGGDAIVAQSGINAMADLKGRRVAVESGALGAYLISRALEINGMTIGDIAIVPLEVSAHEEAFLAGEVDAAVTFDPVRTRLLADGGHEIFSSRQLPGEIIDVLVVHRRCLDEYRPQLRALVAGWFDALGVLAEQPQRAAGIIGRRLKLPGAEVLSSYKGLRLPSRQENLQLLGRQATIATAIDRLAKVMVAHQLLARVPEDTAFFTGDLVR